MSPSNTFLIFALASCLLVIRPSSRAHAWSFQHASLEAHRPAQPTAELNVTMPAAMVKVQQIISGIEKQPTCKRVASKKLLQSCATYDGRDAAETHTDEALEKFQELFAVRQTACELEDAQQAMPSVCSPVLHPDHPDTRYINDCLNALFAGNNHWTTFMGLKNQALITCHAMRSEADKEESLHVMKVLLRAVTDVNGQLVLSQNQLEKLFQDLARVQQGMRTFYQELHNNSHEIKATVQGLFLTMQDKMMATHNDISTLQHTMNAAASQFQDYSNDVRAAFERSSALGTDVETWSEGMSKLQEEIAEMQNKHQYQLALVMDEFAQKVYATTNSVELANNMTSAMAEKIEQLNNELEVPVGKIGRLNLGMHELAEQQQYMQEMQSQTQQLATQTTEIMRETLHGVTQLAETVRDITAFVGFLLGGLVPSTAFSVWWLVSTSVTCAMFLACGWSLRTSSIVGTGMGFGFATALKNVPTPIDLFGGIVNKHSLLSEHLACQGSIAVMLCVGASIGVAGSWIFRRLSPQTSRIAEAEAALYDPASPRFDNEANKMLAFA